MLRLRNAIIVVLAVALAALAAPIAGAEAKKRPTCKPKHSKTVEVSKAIRVYRITRKSKNREGDPVTTTYACRNKTRRKVRMDALTQSDPDPVGTMAKRIQLRGRFVAYGLEDVDQAAGKVPDATRPGDKVVRTDIKRKHGLKIVAKTPDFGSLTDLALTRRGAVAWIVATPVGNPNSPTSATSYTVALADGAGTRSLASGQNVVPGSLAMSSSFVYWRRAATAFSAKLTY